MYGWNRSIQKEYGTIGWWMLSTKVKSRSSDVVPELRVIDKLNDG